MIAIVDIGNSAIKICAVRAGGVPAQITTLSHSAAQDVAMQQALEQAAQVIIACSGAEGTAVSVTEILATAGKEVLLLDKSGPVPFNSFYAPGQAGIDRLANVAAAINEIGFPVIIVDAGSAITLEVVSPDAVFLGGAILPGFGLQAAALHSGTAGLPEVTLEAATPTIGPDTTSAIRTGIMNGCLGAVDRLIRQTLDEPGMAGANLIFTGGDGELIYDSLGTAEAVWSPDLTLRGLYLLAVHQYHGRLAAR